MFIRKFQRHNRQSQTHKPIKINQPPQFNSTFSRAKVDLTTIILEAYQELWEFEKPPRELVTLAKRKAKKFLIANNLHHYCPADLTGKAVYGLLILKDDIAEEYLSGECPI